MKRYFRTKDGKIYEFVEVKTIATIETIVVKRGLDTKCIFDKDIDKQADTIEELCDELVIVNTTDNRDNQVISKYDFRRIYEYSGDNDYKIYGAIWTDEGLQFVARMNNEGELKLL